MVPTPSCSQTGVYRIHNTVNGKTYVGSTVRTFSKRLSEHRGDLDAGRHAARYLQRAWLKYGPDAFVFEPVLCCSVEDCRIFEQLVVDDWKPAYNSRVIDVGSNLGLTWTLSEESKQRQSEYHKNRPEQHKQRLILAAQHQPESKRVKMSEYALNHRTEEHKEKLAKVSASALKRARMGKSTLGKKRSKETRARQSAAQKLVQSRPGIRAASSAIRKGVPASKHRCEALKLAARERSSLTAGAVMTIRDLAAAGMSNPEIGLRFGVHRRTVSDIVRRKTWSDVL